MKKFRNSWFLHPGEVFGESSILGNNKRKEAAIAEDTVIFCVMKEEKFRKLLLKSPALNLKFSQLLRKRLEKAQKRLQDISCKIISKES
ncbi:MAG: Crp/Fnr family transcriptional regulator [Bacteroidota bacterium]